VSAFPCRLFRVGSASARPSQVPATQPSTTPGPGRERWRPHSSSIRMGRTRPQRGRRPSRPSGGTRP
jgi:hypothetical protein